MCPPPFGCSKHRYKTAHLDAHQNPRGSCLDWVFTNVDSHGDLNLTHHGLADSQFVLLESGKSTQWLCKGQH